MCKTIRIFTLCSCIIIKGTYALNPVDVTDIIFNMGSGNEKTFYYKFAAGDTVICNAAVTKGSDISEISIQEWPSSIKFQAIAVKSVEDKKIYVSKTNVFTFQFKNTATLKSKTYQLDIKRIPATEGLIAFNTSVEWDTIYDTTYVAAIETILVKMDTIPEEIVNTQLKLGSQLTGNTRSYVQVNLPENISSWAYWIGVGQEAADGLQAMANTLPETAGLLGITSPVAAFAVGLIPDLFSMNKGMDINYYIIADYTNLCNFMNGQTFYQSKEGKNRITDCSKMSSVLGGTLYLGFDNSYSAMTSKLVTVKIAAVKIVPKYEYRESKRLVINSKETPKLDN